MVYPIGEVPDYKPTITLSTKDNPSLPDLGIDDEGIVVLKFKVTGVNKYDDEAGDDNNISYTLEYEVDDVQVKAPSLQEATKRAGKSKDIYVKTQSNPAP